MQSNYSNSRSVSRWLIAGLVLFCAAVPSEASLFTGSGTNFLTGQPLAASANFEITGNNLVVTLTNSSTADVVAPSDVLTTLFFNTSGSAMFTAATSAVVGAGSSVLFPPPGTGNPPGSGTDLGGVVGGEWLFRTGVTNGPGANSINSAGLGLNGTAFNFPGSNLQGPVNVNGLEYGITSAGDDPTTGNSSVTGTNALIQDSVVFTLTFKGDLTMDQISNVGFQYGTDLEEPFVPGDRMVIPEPFSVAVWSVLGLLVGCAGWWHRSQRWR